MLSKNRGLSRFFVCMTGILILFMCISPCLATYNFEGTPEQEKLIETTSGMVKGGLYVDGGEGIKETPYVQEFNIPGDSVKWVRVYVGVWGGTEAKTGTLDLTVNGKALDSVELEGKADNGDEENPNPAIYCSGHGVYWIAYDVTSNISTGPVKVEAKTGGNIDGRVYGIVLAAVYEDENGQEQKYWVEEGNINLHGKGWSEDIESTHDEAFAEFSGDVDVDTYKTANLAVVYLCGSPGLDDSLYFNDKQLSDGDNKKDIANSKGYFDFKFFDVLDFLAKDDNKLKFQRDNEDYVHPVLAALSLGTGEEGSSADLIVSDLTLPVLDAGKDNTIKANIKNIGSDLASGCQAALYADGKIVSTASVSSLPSEKSRTIEFNWKPASAGEKVLKVQVDYTNRVKELCEINNWNTPVLAKIVDRTPPELKIKSPEDGSLVDAGNIMVSGTVEDTNKNLSVDVNGQKALLSAGNWNAKVPVVAGSNTIVVSAVDGANNTAKELIVVDGKASSSSHFKGSSGSRTKTKSTSQTMDSQNNKSEKQAVFPEYYGEIGLISAAIFITYQNRRRQP